MKRRWIYLTAAVLIVGGVASAAVAQPGRAGQPTPWASLNLTDAQKQQLEELRSEHREALQALRQSGDESGPEARAALWAEHREKLAQILTEEQLAQLDKMRAQRLQWRRDHRGGMGRPEAGPGRHMGPRDHLDRPGPGRQSMGDLYARLGLSDKQREAIYELRQKQGKEMAELTEKHRAALEKVLTDEQRQELARMKDEAFYGRRGRGPRP